jgi:hypothetical protein
MFKKMPRMQFKFGYQEGVQEEKIGKPILQIPDIQMQAMWTPVHFKRQFLIPLRQPQPPSSDHIRISS